MTVPIPLTVVGGYLGAGKTSLVNHVLREARGIGIAVLVNDFGALPIDADLIEARSAGLISVSGGCICCSFGSDLMGSLMTLSQRTPCPDHVLVETSGVALPGSVARSAALISAFSIDSVVVLADAETIRARAGHRYMGDTIARQLAEADLVLLNKTDLVTADEIDNLRAWVSREAPQAGRIEAVRGQVPVEVLLGSGHARRRANVSSAPSARAMLAVEDATTRYESQSLPLHEPIDVELLARELAGNGCGVIRAKGVLQDTDGSIKTLHVVGARWEVMTFAGSRKTGTGLACIGVRGQFDLVRVERAVAVAASTELPVAATDAYTRRPNIRR